MDDNSPNLQELELKLSDLAVAVRTEDTAEVWKLVESTAHAIANGLRVRHGPVDNHTALGNTDLAQTLTTLVSLALHSSACPEAQYTNPIVELLRVCANFCLDHDGNRQRLLDAGLPQALVALLKGYAASIPSQATRDALQISIADLKVVRTAVGVLLNASIGFDPIKKQLIDLEAALTILKLSTAIYPPGAWLIDRQTPIGSTPDEIEESWNLRSGLSSWAWREIQELKDTKDDSTPLFTQDVLPYLVPPLILYTTKKSQTPSSPPFPLDSQLFASLVLADFESLEESCTLIESLSLDLEDIRLSFARGYHFPAEHNDVPCLSAILDFIQDGNYSPLWKHVPTITGAELKRKEKEFDICKAALIKAVVEVAGEEGNEDVLWDDSEASKPGGDFVWRMIQWLKGYVHDMDGGQGDYHGRDDMAICASLSLGNLARKEHHTSVLLSQPHSLASILASPRLLSPSTDIKVKHGIIGLLKHLAQSSIQSPEIHLTLGNAGIIQAVSQSGIWDEKSDAMADVVQAGAIGVVKHLCNSVVENTFALVLPSTSITPPPPTGLSQILALVRRSDSVPIRSEGTRVLVNVIKSLWSNVSLVASPVVGGPSLANGLPEGDDKTGKKESAKKAVSSVECAAALSNLITRSGKFPTLVNEGVVALALLSTQPTGAPLVLSAIQTPLHGVDLHQQDPPTEPPSASTSTNSDLSSPVMTTPSTHHGGRLPKPRTALDMLIGVLKNVDNPANFLTEVRVNVCSLFLQINRNTTAQDLTVVKDTVRPVLEDVYDSVKDTKGGKEEMLAKSTRRLLDAWKTG